jgi:alkanesulfonate monooxygenase SsuD/methylene tetrahydromethanopterin reductase-like flavin-dependent oxidoreductase (luciferase family)
VAAALEASGVDACHVTDHPYPPRTWLDAGGHRALDPFVTLSFAAAVTTRLRLHTNVLVAGYRNPVLAAHAIATLDALSGGRMIIGLGMGYLRAEFAALGVDHQRRGALLDQAVAAMTAAWSGATENVLIPAASTDLVRRELSGCDQAGGRGRPGMGAVPGVEVHGQAYSHGRTGRPERAQTGHRPVTCGG